MSQKLIELQRQIDEPSIIVGDINTPLTGTDAAGGNIGEGIVEPNTTIGELNIMGMHALLHPRTGEFSSSSMDYSPR